MAQTATTPKPEARGWRNRRSWLTLASLVCLGACGEDSATTPPATTQTEDPATTAEQGPPNQDVSMGEATDQDPQNTSTMQGNGPGAETPADSGGGAGIGAQGPAAPMAQGEGAQTPAEAPAQMGEEGPEGMPAQMPNEMPGAPEGEPGGEDEQANSEPTEVPITVEFPGKLDDWCTDQADNFSFFVTSMDALWALSASTPGDTTGGFGGDFGGLEGADAICQTIAKATGHGTQTWHAFLSATDDGEGNPVHAIERIGEGPWHDAQGRLISQDIAGLLAGDRPAGDPEAVADMVDECGVPLTATGAVHDVVTGSDKQGRLSRNDPAATCNDWTSTTAMATTTGQFGEGGVMCGHSFPRMLPDFLAGAVPAGKNWVSDHGLRGCGKGANLIQDGPGSGTCIGCSGGYGALYCFAQ